MRIDSVVAITHSVAAQLHIRCRRAAAVVMAEAGAAVVTVPLQVPMTEETIPLPEDP